MHTSSASIFLPTYLAPSASERIDELFEQAIEARGTGRGAGNLYGGPAGPEAMLSAFRLLVQDTPLVRFGHVAANRVIEAVAMGCSAVHIVDLGIGHGLQWDDMLVRFAARAVPPRIRITGVDLPAPCISNPTEALARTGARLEALASQLGLDFEFEAIASSVEELDCPVSLDGEKLFVNAALALHHVADSDAVVDPETSRDAILRRIASWRPMLVTLIEPDVAHNSLPFEQRVAESRRHYRLVFDVLAHLFPSDPLERTTVEVDFFGNEIMNICAEGTARVERHDRIDTWCRKMTDAGFQSISLGMMCRSQTQELELRHPFTVESRGPAMALCFRGESVIGVSAWTPR